MNPGLLDAVATLLLVVALAGLVGRDAAPSPPGSPRRAGMRRWLRIAGPVAGVTLVITLAARLFLA